jgi:hypothetical protein
MMDLQIVVMPGVHRVDLPLLRLMAQSFGWKIQQARSAEELKILAGVGKIGAVLFQEESLSTGGAWLETLVKLQAASPESRFVACSDFSSAIDYPKMCRAGLFHLVWLPLKKNEILQCFGFVWEAEKRSAALASSAGRLIQMKRAAG